MKPKKLAMKFWAIEKNQKLYPYAFKRYLLAQDERSSVRYKRTTAKYVMLDILEGIS